MSGLIPENFRVTDLQSRNITFNWSHPPQTNVSINITGYILNCSNRSAEVDQNSITLSIEVDQNSTTAVVDGLIPFTNYSCYIYAQVKGNRGQLSVVVNMTTAEESKLSVAKYSSSHTITLL